MLDFLDVMKVWLGSDPPPFSGAPGAGVFRPVIRPHSLEHPELEFSGPSQGDRLAVSPGFINVIGVLLPMALWGRTSL